MNTPRDVSVPRPWIRYFARSIDTTLASLIIAIPVGIFSGPTHDYPILLQMLVLVTWVPIESILISRFGSTPGKWLLSTRITQRSEEPISFQTALNRSFSVWWRGLGIGLPVVSFVCQILSWKQLKEKHITPWDQENNLIVMHEPLDSIKIASVVLFYGAMVAILVIEMSASGVPF